MVNNNQISFVSRNFGEATNGITLKCKDIRFSNKLVFLSKPERALDGTLIVGSEFYYVPQAEFAIAAMSADDYTVFVRIVNAPTFQMNCFDYELGKQVSREMMLNELSRDRLLGSGGNIEMLVNVKLSAVSVRSYKNYTELYSNE